MILSLEMWRSYVHRLHALDLHIPLGAVQTLYGMCPSTMPADMHFQKGTEETASPLEPPAAMACCCFF